MTIQWHDEDDDDNDDELQRGSKNRRGCDMQIRKGKLSCFTSFSTGQQIPTGLEQQNRAELASESACLCVTKSVMANDSHLEEEHSANFLNGLSAQQ